MKKVIDLGKQDVKQNGNALAVKLPERWLIAHSLTIGDPLYSILTVDGEIRVHLEQVEWSKKAKIRSAASRGAAYLTLSAKHTREVGIGVGTNVHLIADIENGILSIRRSG